MFPVRTKYFGSRNRIILSSTITTAIQWRFCVALLGESHSVHAKEMQRSYRYILITGRSRDLSSVPLIFGESFLKNMLPTSLG
jgi:hypothetical protein